MGRAALVLGADVADHARARAVATAVEAEWGRVDALVNNAASPTRRASCFPCMRG